MKNLVLIGMPSSGKSTAGKAVAKKLGWGFLDSDELIVNRTGQPLSRIIAELGTDGFLQVENAVNGSLSCCRTVVSTGGSVCYSSEAMAHLKSLGKVIYLKLSAEEVARRIKSFEKRGVVMRGNITTAEELAAERAPLYERYADAVVECDGKSVEETVAEIIARMEGE